MLCNKSLQLFPYVRFLHKEAQNRTAQHEVNVANTLTKPSSEHQNTPAVNHNKVHLIHNHSNELS